MASAVLNTPKPENECANSKTLWTSRYFMTNRLPSLIDQPDWPDRSKWVSSFTSQVLHDTEGTFRDPLPWNEAEKKDLMQQLQDGVHLIEIARRHQRYVPTVECMRLDMLRELEKRLLG